MGNLFFGPPPLPPVDRRRLFFFTLMLHGLGSLMGWNMFITAKDYFVEYKLANSKTRPDQFLVYVGYASHTPNFIFNWLNVFIRIGGDLNTRILLSLILEIGVFVVTVTLAMLNTSSWPDTFLWLTLASIFCFHTCNAVYLNSLYGVAAKFPPNYMGSFILGSNICGTLVVLLNWATDLAGGSVRTSAIYYFIGGLIVQLICLDTFYALSLNKFFRYHTSHHASQPSPENNQESGIPFLQILERIWVQLYNVFITFTVTLAIFPAVQSDIQPIAPNHLGNNFTRVTCFLTFNFMAMIGNITASLYQIPSRKYLAIFTTLRIGFVVFFLFCNYRPQKINRTAKVLVTSDAIYWLGSFIFAWSHGHAASLGMMYVAGNVDPKYAPNAGMLGGAVLVSGLLSGIIFSGFSSTFISM